MNKAKRRKKFTDTIARHQRNNNKNSSDRDNDNVSVYLYIHIWIQLKCVYVMRSISTYSVYALHCEFFILFALLLATHWPLYNTVYYAHKHSLSDINANKHKQSQHRSSLAHSNNRHRIERNYNGHNVYFVVHFPLTTCISSNPSRERERRKNESVWVNLCVLKFNMQTIVAVNWSLSTNLTVYTKYSPFDDLSYAFCYGRER